MTNTDSDDYIDESNVPPSTNVIVLLRLLLKKDYVELKQVNSISHWSAVTNFRVDLEPMKKES